MTRKLPFRVLTGRTRFATVAAIVAIGVTGAAAVGANVGILDSSSSTKTGALSAAGDLTTASTQTVDVYLDGSTTSAAQPASAPTTGATAPNAASNAAPSAAPNGGSRAQQYAVDNAGTVDVVTTDTGLRLDNVRPAPGWTWSSAQAGPTSVLATFTDGARTLEFSAVLNPDGTIAARVDEPIVTAAPAGGSGSSAGSSGSYDDDDDHDDDDHDDDDDHEYEGGDDDD